MITKYFADDGKQFDTADEAVKHDEEVKKETEAKRLKQTEQQKREQEVIDACKQYSELYRKYIQDYVNKNVNDNWYMPLMDWRLRWM